jgi:hypothetical protein
MRGRRPIREGSGLQIDQIRRVFILVDEFVDGQLHMFPAYAIHSVIPFLTGRPEECLFVLLRKRQLKLGFFAVTIIRYRKRFPNFFVVIQILAQF